MNEKKYEIKFIELTNPCGGDVCAEFGLTISSPFIGKGIFTTNSIRDIGDGKAINFYGCSSIAKAAGAKGKDILFRITDEEYKDILETEENQKNRMRAKLKFRKIDSWVWAVGGDTGKLYVSNDCFSPLELRLMPEVMERIAYLEKKGGKIIEKLEKHSEKIDRKTCLYTESWYRISDENLDKIERKIRKEDKVEEEKKKEKQAIRKKEIEAIFERAKKTEKKQILRKWTAECNDPNEECDWDEMTEYALPDGKKETIRDHTW